MAKLPQKVVRLMVNHECYPHKYTQRYVMDKLNLGYDYNKFYRMFYQAVVKK